MIKRLSILLVLMHFSGAATVGCMWNKCGSSECECPMHYVNCACPCKTRYISSDRGLCRICGHYGLPTRGVINKLDTFEFEYN